MKNDNWRVRILDSNAKYDADYKIAYESWKQCWWGIFKQIEKPHLLFSDQFTRQDSILALFDGNACVGLTLFTIADLEQPVSREDSYFAVWPKETVQKLTSRGSNILVLSYFSITEPYRKTVNKVSAKDMLLGLDLKYFLETGCDAMTGTPRQYKNVNNLSYRWGAQPLKQSVKFNGELNDLICYYQDSVIENAVPELTALVDKIWSDCIDIKRSKAA